MAVSNKDRVGVALDALKIGLLPFVEREMRSRLGSNWHVDAARSFVAEKGWSKERLQRDLDAQALLSIMWDNWDLVFSKILGRAERTLIAELRTIRNNWAHQQPFSTDDAYRALDSIERLLSSISASEAVEIGKQKFELLRVKYEEQAKQEQRRIAHAPIEGQPKAGLKTWREIITPHHDVATGRYQQAEFAVDLWQVHCGEGASEYKEPKEFYRRTYITKGLEQLLSRGLARLTGSGGDPVVELKTNFGGGKTHSMLALYHLFSGVNPQELTGLDSILAGIDIKKIPKKVYRAVLVGTKLSPGQPSKKPDGTIVNTLWGEMAWQLGGAAGYAIIAQADKTATNPGDSLRELFNKYSPCLVLIDEWVAYARQLYQTNDLPAGSFDTHFTFAQSLTECAKAAKNAFLVVSIPASDAEIGGEGGAKALERLNMAIGRVEATWNPATADESFEIVRRRLFQDISDPSLYTARDAVVKAFMELYRQQKAEFPSGCAEAKYEKRLIDAYPIHPCLFDSLYNDWSTLDKFQRTRGVLRLMAAVIHRLWEQGDSGLMIMPSNIPLEDAIVQPELTRYLDDEQPWAPIISQDVDGPNSLPLLTDRENPNLQRYSASRRVARSIFMSTAPHVTAKTRGITDKEIKLSCVQPGEVIGTFGDALRRLAANSTHLYEDGPHYYYSPKPNVTRLAKDRAANIEDYKVVERLEEILRDKKTLGSSEFSKVYCAPGGPSDVPDETSARLVIFGAHQRHGAKQMDSSAILFGNQIMNQKGGGSRVFRNTLVFLAADGARMKDLEQGIRYLLAWESIVNEAESESLNLDVYQRKTAETKLGDAKGTVESRVKETFIWLLIPEQTDDGSFTWEETRLQGGDGLAARVSKKLIQDEHLLVAMSPTRLAMELNKRLWKDADHVPTKRLWDYFCSYTYLPRLRDEAVLVDAIQNGVSELMWIENFGFAEGFDEKQKRYLGLKGGCSIKATISSTSMLVKGHIAQAQLRADFDLPGSQMVSNSNFGETSQGFLAELTAAKSSANEKSAFRLVSSQPTRFYGTISTDPMRFIADAGKVANEVIAHLSKLVGSDVKITVEIEANCPKGTPEDVVRTVTENCKTLKFSSHGFERE